MGRLWESAKWGQKGQRRLNGFYRSKTGMVRHTGKERMESGLVIKFSLALSKFVRH